MRTKPLLTFLLALNAVASSVSAQFTLFDDDAALSPAPIILFEDAPPYTRQAAEELATYIEKVCGTKPQLIEGAADKVPERAIWVGLQPALKSVFPELDLELEKPEEIVIAANDRHLVIAGRDRWDPQNLVVEGIDEKIVGRQLEYGTVNAVYTFLQDYLGVRWLWPGELGEDVPEQTKITFKPFEYRYYPQIRARGGAFNFSTLSNKGYGRAHDWTRLQRLQLGSLEMSGGHGFADWWDRFHETQPGLFALQPDGTRSGHPNPRTAKLCQSNPSVWKQWLADVEKQLEKDPNARVFNGSPNDGWSSGHCVCENCRAWDHPDGEPRLMHWHHFREERPALSDRHVTFANRLAGLLQERFPDREYYVLMLSYGHSRPAPIKARPADNVIMSSVANFYGRTKLVDRGSTWGTTHRDQFKAWGELSAHVTWRPNTGSPAGWQQGVPDVSIEQTIKDIKFVAENHCIGIYIDAVWEHWATQGPQYYVMAQLLWDPSRDGQAILDDYYRRAFGPASEEVRGYFETIEKERMAYVEKYGYGAGAFNLPRLFTDELLAKSENSLSEAAEAVADGPEVYRKRVKFVRAGLTFTQLVIENINAMESYWREEDEALGKKVKANWETMERLCQSNPFAINWGPVRPSGSRMIGQHPDYPNPKWKPNEVKDLDQN